MNEKVIIKSEHYNITSCVKIIVLLGLLITIFWNIAGFSHSAASYEDKMSLDYWSEEELIAMYGTKEEYMFDHFFASYYTCHVSGLYSFVPLVLCVIIGSILYFGMKSYSLTVTDKRIYGKIWLGKRVDLPADSISSISKSSLFQGITVATSSGVVGFLLVKNADQIYNELNNLMISRQTAEMNHRANEKVECFNYISKADELKKFKELLDQGVITQEEFEDKKKQLLGI